MTKQELRKIYRNKRKELTATERSKMDDLLLIQFQKIALPYIYSLFTFWPIEDNHEPATHLISDYLSFINPALVTAYQLPMMMNCSPKTNMEFMNLLEVIFYYPKLLI